VAVEQELLEAARAGGLEPADGEPGGLVVMLSGGRDSTCLLDVSQRLLGASAIAALHVNYGLREQAGEDERHCSALCESLDIELRVVHAARPRARGAYAADAADGNERATADGGRAATGNLQAWARDVRYEAAAAMADERDARFATGHTASDQVETILYRLAASPGRRALLGMVAREGRLVRPLLAVTRSQTADYCRARGLAWCDDESNEDDSFARTRVRSKLVPALRAVHPAAEANVLRTAALLREETDLLDGLVDAELAGVAEIETARLRELPAALARLVVVRLAEDAAGTYVPQAGARVAEILALAERGGRAELHVGGRAGAVIEHGRLRMVKLPERAGGRDREPPRDD